LTATIAPKLGLGFPSWRVVPHGWGVIEVELLRMIERQHGVIGQSQLSQEFNWSPSRLSRARRTGMFVDVTPSVVRLASSSETFRLRCMALQLHLDGCGFLSGMTAGHLYGLRSMATAPVRATVPEATRRRIPTWASVSRSSWFDEADRQRHADGLIVATPLRTLFGLAATLHPHRFGRAAEDAWNLGLISPDDAASYLEEHRCRGKNGVAVLEQWLAGVSGRARPAQSGFEQLVIECLTRVGLPAPDRQHPVHLPTGETIHLDIAWPEIRLAVEPGHSRWHSGALQQQRDQARDRACSEQGWHIVRFDESFRNDPLAAARQVSRIYFARSRQLSEPTLRPAQ
jgi:hypothetical protein